MAISMNSIVPDWKLPGTSIEVDPSQAGTPVNPKYALLIGHKNNAGAALPNLPVAIASQADADAQFGAGSMLSAMFRRFFGINRSQVLFCLPIAEVSAGTVAQGDITVSSAPSASGVLPLYIAGQKVVVSIAQTDTPNQVATKINAAINAATDLPVTSTVASAVVSLTSKWKGETASDIRVEDSILGPNGGESLPAGLALTYPSGNKLAGGTGTPDLTSAISNLGDAPWKFVALAFGDSGALAAVGTEWGFGDGGRWGWIRQSYGQVMGAVRALYSNLMILGPTRNYPVISQMAVEPRSPSPTWEWAAAFCGQAARAFTLDPARPLHTLELSGIVPAPTSGRFSKTELNAMAKVGFAIQGTDLDGVNTGVPQILREQTAYQKNTLGQADNAYELMTTLATLDEIFSRVRQRMAALFPRAKLANDGTRFGAGQAIVTPKIIKGAIIALYSELESDGLVENISAFKSTLIVERSSTEPNTVAVLFPPDLINQLRRLNIKAQFRLQFPAVAA